MPSPLQSDSILSQETVLGVWHKSRRLCLLSTLSFLIGGGLFVSSFAPQWLAALLISMGIPFAFASGTVWWLIREHPYVTEHKQDPQDEQQSSENPQPSEHDKQSNEHRNTEEHLAYDDVDQEKQFTPP